MLNRIFIAALSIFFTVSAVSASEPIKIGVSLGLTGKYSEMSDMQMKGFKLWEKDVNSRGGLLGRKVQLIIYDDKSEPKDAKSLYEYLILKDRVDLVFGPYSSEITEAILPVTEEYGYPVIASGASADRLWQKGYEGVFGIYAPASRYATGFLEMLVMNNLNNIAILHAHDSFSKDIADGTKKWAERFGLKVVLFQGFNKGIQNLDNIARKAKASNPQVLIVCGHFEEAVRMRLSLKKIGWYPKAYFASVGPALQAFQDQLKSDADYVFSSSQWEHHGGVRPLGCDEFYALYVKTYNQKPSYHAATAYAGGQILEAAVIKAQSLDTVKLRRILAAMDTISIVGRYGVNASGMQIKHFNLIIQWQNGRKEVIWPEENRTAEPIFK